MSESLTESVSNHILPTLNVDTPPSRSTTGLTLPLSVIRIICQQLAANKFQSSLASLQRTSHALYDLVTPILYRHIYIEYEDWNDRIPSLFDTTFDLSASMTWTRDNDETYSLPTNIFLSNEASSIWKRRTKRLGYIQSLTFKIRDYKPNARQSLPQLVWPPRFPITIPGSMEYERTSTPGPTRNSYTMNWELWLDGISSCPLFRSFTTLKVIAEREVDEEEQIAREIRHRWSIGLKEKDHRAISHKDYTHHVCGTTKFLRGSQSDPFCNVNDAHESSDVDFDFDMQVRANSVWSFNDTCIDFNPKDHRQGRPPLHTGWLLGRLYPDERDTYRSLVKLTRRTGNREVRLLAFFKRVRRVKLGLDIPEQLLYLPHYPEKITSFLEDLKLTSSKVYIYHLLDHESGDIEGQIQTILAPLKSYVREWVDKLDTMATVQKEEAYETIMRVVKLDPTPPGDRGMCLACDRPL